MRGKTAATERSLGWPARVAVGGLVVVGLVPALADPIVLLFYGSYASVGAWLAIRRPRNFLGWIMVAIAFGFIAQATSPVIDPTAMMLGTASLVDRLDAWRGAWGAGASFTGFIAIAVLFPSGRLPEHPWRLPAVLLITSSLMLTLLAAFAPTVPIEQRDALTRAMVPNPFAVLPEAAVWSVVPIDGLVLLGIIPLVVAVLGMVARYRRATGALKLQLRWLVASIAFVVTAVVAGLVVMTLLGEAIGDAAWIPAIIAYPCIPIAIGIAVLRYRLYEIDRIISRTIGWALVTGMLVGAFALLVVASSAVLEPLTGGNTLAVAGSTLVVVALFAPLRRWVQVAVDRRFDRARYDGERLLTAFGDRLRDEVDLNTIRTEVIAAIETSIRPTRVGLWLRDVTDPSDQSAS